MESMTEVATQMNKKVNRLKLGLEVIFKNCCTREGHLTKEHIVRMVQRLAKDHQEAQDFKCTLDTAGVIIHALDSDGNGTIEYQEWSEWIVKGAKKSVQQREQMKGTSEILKNTVVFLEVICAIATKISARPDIETLRDSLVAMFQDAMQPDTDGHLWPVDIIAMNDKLSKKYPDIAFVPAMNKQVSETIVQSLDSDGNGSVELDEFVPWLMKGMSKTKEQRQQFAAQGETFQMLIQFMESMTEVATQMNKKVNRLKPGLTQLFTKYDTTGEGMSSKDIYAMVTDLSSQYTKYANDWNEETSTLIVDALDVDEVRNHLHRQSTVNSRIRCEGGTMCHQFESYGVLTPFSFCLFVFSSSFSRPFP
jgi:Ca2+-binding EF-hand superfamily protein